MTYANRDTQQGWKLKPEMPIKNAPAQGSDADRLSVQGVSVAMRELERVIADIAPTDIPVLLVGESGTGKEVLAAEIHERSRRQSEPFVKLSCAALTPPSLNEWLYGAGQGDGGNSSPRPGTVFLDEVSELDPTCQSILLLALSDGDMVPQPRCRGARVISATSRNLEEEMRARHFREELYYRVNGVCLRLPPLRQRKEDVPALVDYFLTKYAALFGHPRPSLSSQTLQILLDHSWPGNIRQLENAVKKIVALGEERLVVADLGPSLVEEPSTNGPAEGISLKQAARLASRKAERELILKALARTRWNRKRAAQELQISYKALLYKLKQISLEDSAAS